MNKLPINKLDRAQYIQCVKEYYLQKKKHSRKSIEWHKHRILSRLNPRVDKGQRIEIAQNVAYYSNNTKESMVHLNVIDNEEIITHHPLRKWLVQEHHRIIRALRYLVDEGKIESNITTKEWDVSLALGVAMTRKFYMCKEK